MSPVATPTRTPTASAAGARIRTLRCSWSHRPAPEITERQTLVTTGIEDAIAAARKVAGDKDVGLMGGGVLTAALRAGLVDEVVLHQVPVLLGGGRSFFQELPEHIHLRLLEVVPAPGVTHLHYEVVH